MQEGLKRRQVGEVLADNNRATPPPLNAGAASESTPLMPPLMLPLMPRRSST